MKQLEFSTEKFSTLNYKRASTEINQGELSDTLTYLYIGYKFQQLRRMIKGFKNSYNFADFKSAFQALSLMDAGEGLPDVILFDGTFNQREINDFLKAIHEKFRCKNIVAVAELTGCSKQQINTLKHSKFIDDLIIVDTPGESLLLKAKFLKRTKFQQDPTLLRDKLQSGIGPKDIVKSLLKRFFDIAVSLTLLIVLSPILLLIAAAIKLESKGPVLYVAPRAGKGYKIFRFYKFRTMVADADKKINELSHLNQYEDTGNGAVFFKINNDPRITKVGAFLRNHSLDELLQLVNVLLGDMSFVGNRPLPLYEAETLTTDAHAFRFMAPAGITGLWQIKKRGDSNMSVQERINLDIDYAKKNNFVYDLWIIANTPTALLQKNNV